MSSTKQKIKERKQMLGLKTMMDYAPAVRATTRRELKKLLTQDYIESTVRAEVEARLGELRLEILGKLEARLNEEKPIDQEPIPKGFLLSSLLLAESFAYLSRQREESLHFCTGVRIGQCWTVDTLIPVGLKNATVVSAEADNPDVFRVLSRLDRMGHPLTGVIHIHPGQGPQANCPSGVDRAYMERLSGRHLVFGIWARDAQLRLLTLPEGEEVEIFGEGVEELGKKGNERTYRLSSPGQSVLGYDAGLTGAVAVGRKLV